MKRFHYFLITLWAAISCDLSAQTNEQSNEPHTVNRMFDTVFDNQGNKYFLSDLNIFSSNSSKYGSGTINAISNYSCSAGYFNLYFGMGSCFDGTTTAASDKRNVLCNLFTDICGFIHSPLSVPGNTVRVNLYCGDLTAATSTNVLGLASSIYLCPANATNPNQGIVRSQVEKAIISGVDPYQNMPLSVFGSANFYHGLLRLNPSTTYTWNCNLSTATMSPSEYDLYSVMFHEAMHVLGFGSLIDFNGVSLAGSANNFFAQYDRFLRDPSGNNPLLVSSNTLCANTDLTCTTTINSNTCSPLDITNCANAFKYVSNTGTVSVFTPSCFVPASSLSHFEDMCSYGSFTTSCTPTPTSPGYNNLYFITSNAFGQGTCHIKRRITKEELNVLCDLGYNTTGTLVSSVNGASFSYTSGNCPGLNVWGRSDGVNSTGLYTITTATTSISIPISNLTTNDSPFTSTISCVEVVYTNTLTNASVSVSSGSVIVTANQGAGLIVLRYFPKNIGGDFGNATYVYVYFLPGGCSSPGSCNMIQNGGFESTSGQMCGDITTVSQINCWGAHVASPELFTRACSSNTALTLGSGTGLAPNLDTWNGTPNDHVVFTALALNPSMNIYGAETLKNNLSAALTPNQTYQLSFLIYIPTALWPLPINTNAIPFVITAASSPSFAFAPSIPHPNNLNILAEFTVNASNTPSWTAVTQTFVFSSPGSVSHSVFHLGANGVKTASIGLPAGGNAFCFFDEVSLLPLPTITFSIPSSANFVTSTFTNLAQYASAVPGSFSGPGVTATTNSAGTTYNFNASQTLSPGTYPVAFTYTSSGCSGTLWQNITVHGIEILNSAPCISSYTLRSTNTGTNVTYTWSPGGANTRTVVVTPTTTTVYSVTVSDGTSSATYTKTLNALTLTPIGFTNTPTQVCVGQSDIYLENLLAPSTATGGSWNATQYTHTTVISGSLITVLPLNSNSITPGVYTITYYLPVSGVSPTVCTQFAQFSFTVLPNTFTLSPVSTTFCSSSPANITVSVNPVPATGIYTYTWQPGGLLGQSQSILPGSSTIYTITASSGTCASATNTLAVTVYTNCCPPFNIPLFTGTTLATNQSGLIELHQDVTVPASTSVNLSGSLLFSPGVKITVAGTATLNINNAHLYACSNYMWNGIVVNNNGHIITQNNSLIEDAETAIDISAHTNTTGTMLDATNTVFNHNYIGISISNYTPAISGYPFIITSNVFSSRTLTFTSGLWPSPDDANPMDLRYTTSTTGLAPPYYNQGFAISNLKLPHSNQPSHIGIKLNNVGVTYGGHFYGIKIGTNGSTEFNLFDSHNVCIYAVNSNVEGVNNVFQNQQNTIFGSPLNIGDIYSSGNNVNSAAIMHFEGGLMNTQLNLYSSSPSDGNRFWDCYKAISGYNTYRFWIEKALFRSTQTTSNTTYTIGNSGITMNTNRFQYYIHQNEFTNIANCINIPIAAGYYPPAGSASISTSSSPGIYATHIGILNNTITADASSANYVNKAINVTNPNLFTWQMHSDCSIDKDLCDGLIIRGNLIDNAYRGIYVNGSIGFKTIIQSNTVTLTKDNVLNANQSGIDYRNSVSTNDVYRQSEIIENNIDGNGYTATTGTVAPATSLYFLEKNHGLASPNVLCNGALNSRKGFEFSGQNIAATNTAGTLWLGNQMEGLDYGMIISSNGEIGKQGNISLGTGNTWSVNTMDVYSLNSDAPSSPLWTGTLSTSNPVNRGGNGFPNSSTYTIVNSIFTPTSSAEYSCSEPTAILDPFTSTLTSEDENVVYMRNMALYNFLHFNDSLRAVDDGGPMFYDGMAGSSIDLFMQVEQKIYESATGEVRDLLSLITATNDVETNYVTFYHLYADYIDVRDLGEPYDATDSSGLYDLAQLCPPLDGACINQARALYNYIYNTDLNYPPCYEEGLSRLANNSAETTINEAKMKQRDVQLFPNPAGNWVTVVSTKETEMLTILVSDVSGREVLRKEVKTSAFIANLDLGLINGIYFVTIIHDDKSTTKKLLIAK